MKEKTIKLPRWYYDPKTLVYYDAYEYIKKKGYKKWIDFAMGVGEERYGLELVASHDPLLEDEYVEYNPATGVIKLINK